MDDAALGGVKESLREIRQQLTEQRNGEITRERQLERLATQMERLTEEVHDLARVVRGNGAPGLVQRITTTESELRDLDQKVAEDGAKAWALTERVTTNEGHITNLTNRVSSHGTNSVSLVMILVTALVSGIVGAVIARAIPESSHQSAQQYPQSQVHP